MDAVGFLAIQNIWYCLFLVGFLILARASFQKRQEILHLFGIEEGGNFWRSSLLPFLILITGLIALLRPYAGYTELSVSQPTRDIMVVFDISPSMLTDDVAPSRIEFARRKLRDLISMLQSQGQGARIGIVLFSGMSYLYCPLTNDYSVISAYARSIGPDLITTPGSVLLSALQSAREALKSAHALSSQSSAILLLTDGEESGISPSEIESEAQGLGVPVFSIGFGSEDGKPVPDRQGRFLKDDTGNIVHSKLETETLKLLSDASGGQYQKATLGDQDLRPILAYHSSMDGISGGAKTTVRNYHELGPYLTWMIVALLLLAQFFGKKEILTLALLLSLLPAASRADERLEYEAYRDYSDKNYEEAYDKFRKALSADEKNPALLEATGSAAYHLGKFDEAQKYYEDSLTHGAGFTSRYNLGNSLLQQKKFKEAIESYDEALKEKSNSLEAKFNRDLAKKLLEQENEQNKKNQKQEQQDQNNQQNDEEQQDDDQKQEQNESEENQSEKNDRNSPQSDNEDDMSEQNKERNSQSDMQPDPTPTASNKDQNGDSEKKSEQDQAQPTSSDQKQQGNLEEQPADLKKQEAQAWLDSLEDAPLLLRRHSGNPQEKRSGQQW